MAFAFPYFLLALVPWAAVTLWLLVERPRRVRVPFLPLWRGPAAVPRQRSAIQWPPVSLAAAMAAMLLAIVAAAGPRVRGAASAGALTIVVDRGITMGKSSRMHQAAEAIAAQLPGSGVVDLVMVPDGQLRRMDRASWLGAVRDSAVTAVDTSSDLTTVVRARLRESAGAVVVISNRALSVSDRRVVQVAPEGPMQNLGIVAIAARAEPSPQVMIRLKNEAALTEATLVVATAEHRLSQRVVLPSGGQERSVFVDLPTLGPVVSAKLQVEDDIAADDQAFLVRQRSWPRIEARLALPPELERMFEVYAAHRPPSATSQRVSIVGDAAAAGGSPAIIIPPLPAASTRPADVRVSDHPVVRQADLAAVLGEVRLAAGPPEGDWTPVLRLGGQAAVVVREAPARQAWVGFGSESLARSPQFVVFWSSVLDWTGEGGESFGWSLPQALGSGWRAWEAGPPAGVQAGLWPGVWVHADGRMMAINAPAVPLEELALRTEWRAQLRPLLAAGAGARELSGGLLAASLGALAVAAITWQRRPAAAGVAA